MQCYFVTRDEGFLDAVSLLAKYKLEGADWAHRLSSVDVATGKRDADLIERVERELDAGRSLRAASEAVAASVPVVAATFAGAAKLVENIYRRSREIGKAES
ncbi:MAG: hypothetical protein AB7O57_17500 [Hyphomicrobiaceae bacterium]